MFGFWRMRGVDTVDNTITVVARIRIIAEIRFLITDDYANDYA